MSIKVILTGATGFVGEGVLIECLQHPDVEEVLMINRRPSSVRHAKLKEYIVSDFFALSPTDPQLKGYDACFYCAGISSAGMGEKDYTRITFDTTLHVARTLVEVDPGMLFCHVSGSHTDSSEKGKIMWARVKGKAENALLKLPFRNVYNFRPGFMKPTEGQQQVKSFYRVIGKVSFLVELFFPGQVSTMREVGLAMINSVLKGYPHPTLEVKDIKKLAAAS